MARFIVIASAALLFSVYPLCASGPPLGTTAITFDGFCDGAKLPPVQIPSRTCDLAYFRAHLDELGGRLAYAW
jgi:hypothetical protein